MRSAKVMRAGTGNKTFLYGLKMVIFFIETHYSYIFSKKEFKTILVHSCGDCPVPVVSFFFMDLPTY